MKQHFVYVPRRGLYVREDAANAEPDKARPAAPAPRQIIEAMAPPAETPAESVRDTEPDAVPPMPVRIEGMDLPEEPRKP